MKRRAFFFGVLSLPVVASSVAFDRIEGFGVTGGREGIVYVFSEAEVVGNIVWDRTYDAISIFLPDASICPDPQIEGNIVYASDTGISISATAGAGTRFGSNTVFGCVSGMSINNPNGSAVLVSRNIVSGCSWGDISAGNISRALVSDTPGVSLFTL